MHDVALDGFKMQLNFLVFNFVIGFLDEYSFAVRNTAQKLCKNEEAYINYLISRFAVL